MLKMLQHTPPSHELVFMRSSPNLGVCPIQALAVPCPLPQKSTTTHIIYWNVILKIFSYFFGVGFRAGFRAGFRNGFRNGSRAGFRNGFRAGVL